MEKEFEIKLTEVAERAKSNTHQIQELKEGFKKMQDENKAIYEIASSVKVMAQQLGSIEEKVDETAEGLKRTEAKLEDSERARLTKTADKHEKFKLAIYTAVGSSIAVTIATAILKLAF